MKKKVISSILLLILLLGCYTTCYAFEFSQKTVEEYCNIIKNVKNEPRSQMIYNVISSTYFKAEVENNNIDWSTFENARIWINLSQSPNLTRTSYVSIDKVPAGATALVLSNSKIKNTSAESITRYNFEVVHGLNGISSITYTGSTSANISLNGETNQDATPYLFYYLYENVSNPNNYNYYGWNYYYQILTRGNTATITPNNTPYPIADAYVGNLYTNLDYNVYYYNNNNKVYYNGTIYEISQNVNNGIVVEIRVERQYIVSGQTYYVDIIYNNNILSTTPTGILLYTTSPTTSGDNSGDNVIDLTETNQKLDNIIGIMEEEQETTNILTGQESGEKAETFWNKLYNNLFTMESGEVQELINNFVENTNLEELGTLEVEEQILNILNDEPRRFYNIMERCYNTKFKKQ